MICGNCKKERLITDFINNQKFCYHCVYRINLKKAAEKRTKKAYFCRTCGQGIERVKNQKKRQRTVFCSSACAEKGHKIQLADHWTRKRKKQESWRDGVQTKWKISQE